MCSLNFGTRGSDSRNTPAFESPVPNAVGLSRTQLSLFDERILTRIYSGQNKLSCLGNDSTSEPSAIDRIFQLKEPRAPSDTQSCRGPVDQGSQNPLDDDNAPSYTGKISGIILGDHAILLCCVKYSHIHSRRFKDWIKVGFSIPIPTGLGQGSNRM